MVMVKDGLELASSNSGADRSGYVDELGACGSDRIGICFARSSYGDGRGLHSMVDVSKTCRKSE